MALAMTAPLGAQDRMAVRDQRYQIGVMESVLAQAVEHGAEKTRESMQAVLPPADMLLATPARVRGFRQEGYGVFFDVEVPTLDTTLPLSFLMLDQSGLGLDSALQEIRSAAQKSGDVNLEQALRRIELQLAPLAPLATPGTPETLSGSSANAQAAAGARTVSGSAAVVTPDPRPAPASPMAGARVDAYLTQVRDALRKEVTDALIDAMLEHSRGLEIAPTEWLHIAAKRSEDRPRLSPVDTDAGTTHIRVRGADLTEFLGGKITREQAIDRVEVKLN
ncbi:MAG: hypothetical protein A3H97_05675 [Acidobacteria bacterium RIFCSPLOWO2_02_FULL_65_29]|nr:MAG: hypothetical protein A3H97_05675 [Acidobacteria bacterium RIFCSPLOWO2_02_FULL_65_29]